MNTPFMRYKTNFLVTKQSNNPKKKKKKEYVRCQKKMIKRNALIP